MSSKRKYNIESSSDEYESYAKFKQVNEATPKSKRKPTTDDLKLSNNNKVNLYRSISNGTKLKISCVNPELETSDDLEDDTHTIKTSSDARSIEQGSNDILTTNDLILHKKKNAVPKKRRSSKTIRTKKKNCFDDPNVRMSVSDEDDSLKVITPSEEENIDKNLTLDDSVNIQEIESQIILISSDSGDDLTNFDLISPKKKKIVSKKKKYNSLTKATKKKKMYSADPDVRTSVVHKDNSQKIITSSNSKSPTRNVQQNLPLDNFEIAGRSEKITEDNSDNNEKHTTDGLILYSKKKMSSKKIGRPSFLKRTSKKIDIVDPVVEMSSDHENNTREFNTKNQARNIEEESYLENSNNIGKFKQSSEVNSESEEKLTNYDSILPNEKKVFSKKRVHRSILKRSISKVCIDHSDVETSVVHKDDAKILKTSNDTRKKAQKVPLDDTKNTEQSEQIIENNFKSNDVLTADDFMLPIKKRGRSLSLKGGKIKMCNIDSDVRMPVVHQDDSQRLISSSNSRNIQVESNLEDSESIGELEQSNEVPLEYEDKLINYDLSLPKKKMVASKKSISHSILKKTMRNVDNVNSDLEKSVTSNDDTQVFRISNNSTSRESDSSLDEDENFEELKQISVASSKSKEKLTTDRLRSSEKKKVISNRRVQFSFSEETIRNVSDVDSNLGTSVLSENDSQKYKISCRTRNIEQESSLDDSMDSGEIGKITETNLENNILTTNNLNLLKKKKVVSKKSIHYSTSKKTKRNIQNVLSDVETSVVSEDDVQGSITHKKKRTIEQISPLNNTDNIGNVEQAIETYSENKEIPTTDDLSLSYQKKSVSRKRVCRSTSDRRKKKISYANITSSKKSSTNNLEYLTISDIQPRILMEVLNDSLLEKSSYKSSMTADKNFGADKQIPEITDEPSKPVKPLLKTNDTLNCNVFPSNSSNLNFSSCSGRKIKPKKYGNYEEVQVYSSLSKNHNKSSEEHDVGSSETINLLEQNKEITDTIQLINDNASKKTKPHSKKNKNGEPPTILKDLITETSPNTETDWVKVYSNQLAEINLLQKEVDLLDFMHHLRSALQTTHANYELALEMLEQLYDLNINADMLIKNTDVVDTILKVTKYIGNASEWNVSVQEVLQHAEKACQVRRRAQGVYDMFKSLFTIPDGQTFQEVFDKKVKDFSKTKDKICI